MPRTALRTVLGSRACEMRDEMKMEMEMKPKVIFFLHKKRQKQGDGEFLTFDSGDEDAIYHLRFWRGGIGETEKDGHGDGDANTHYLM
jgi:hypothetical protein